MLNISELERARLKVLFKKAWNGLESQSFQRCTMVIKDSDGDIMTACVLSNSAGQRCAIGWMLDDPGAPGQVSSMDVKLLENRNVTFIRDMRNAHDSSSEPECMKRRLTAVAELWGLG
jgi:hypothetical protein